jgi:hypothetical protein
VWQNNNQPSGGSTSPDFIAWTDQAYGFMYRVYDDTTTGGSTWNYLIEDNGLRWSQYSYSSGNLSSTTDYTVDQTGSGSVSYTRGLTYSGHLLTGIN